MVLSGANFPIWLCLSRHSNCALYLYPRCYRRFFCSHVYFSRPESVRRGAISWPCCSFFLGVPSAFYDVPRTFLCRFVDFSFCVVASSCVFIVYVSVDLISAFRSWVRIFSGVVWFWPSFRFAILHVSFYFLVYVGSRKFVFGTCLSFSLSPFLLLYSVGRARGCWLRLVSFPC